MPNSASQIWPHLQSGERREQQQREQSLSAALYPSLTPQAKARQAAHSADRASLLRHLRELNARVDERLRREGKR
jgi:hypothetical protein